MMTIYIWLGILTFLTGVCQSNIYRLFQLNELNSRAITQTHDALKAHTQTHRIAGWAKMKPINHRTETEQKAIEITEEELNRE